jgi:hypothetical protein
MAVLGSNFYPKLVQLGSEVGMQPEDILAIMISESGISPSAHNPKGGASGLMQFMPSTLGGVGFHGKPEEFRQLSGEAQLPYIKNYIENQMKVNDGPFTSPGQFYVAVFWPVGLKLPGVRRGDPRTAIVEENPATIQDQSGKSYSKKYYNLGIKIDPKFESLAYKQNSLFHGDTPGAITYGDMMKQVEKNKRNPLYQHALASMEKDTGYQPNKQPSNMVAQQNSQPQKNESFQDVLQKFIQMITPTTATASTIVSKKLCKKMLTNNDVLIQIAAPDYTSAVEFSRILCTALDEELMATSYPHTDGEKVEVECSISGPTQECLAAVDQLSQAIANAFQQATTKIGGLAIKTSCIINKKSSYQQISLRTADTNYRKFLLKFM